MIFEDDRTADEKKTHTCIVMMTDSDMSDRENGTSYAGWACRYDDLRAVELWVRRRVDAKRVRIVHGNYRPPSISGHCHIYIVNDDHPSVRCRLCGRRVTIARER